jgi:porin
MPIIPVFLTLGACCRFAPNVGQMPNPCESLQRICPGSSRSWFPWQRQLRLARLWNAPPAPVNVYPLPTQRPDRAAASLLPPSEQTTEAAQAQATQPSGAVLSLQQSTTPAPSPTPAAAPATTGATAQSPVNTRPFGEELIVLPVDHLLGDWYGLRTRLEDNGITPTLTFESDLAGNPVGGKRRGFTEADNLGFDTHFDLDKLYGLEGGTFIYSMSQRSGANLSAIDIGNTFTTQQVYGRETWQVIDVAYLQKLMDGRVELRIGRIAAGDVFDVSPYDYLFMQNAIDGNPVGIFLNAPGMSAYPNATWGAELKVQTTDRTYLRGGLYNGDIAHTHELFDHGLDWSMNGPLFAIGEAVYQVNQLKGDPGLPGNYKLGFWYDGSAYQDFGTKVLGSAAPSLGIESHVMHGNYGFYGLFDQFLIRLGSPDEEILRGIGVTACVQAAPDQERSQMPLFFEAAVLVRGIFADRPRDVAGFGIIYGQFSSDLRDAERLAQQMNPAVGVQHQETVLEWNYTFRFRNGAFFIEPDMQYIIRPGGTGNIPNALVIGAQVGVNF